MRILPVLSAVLAMTAAALAAPAARASSPWNPGSCTAVQDARGYLDVTGSLPRDSYPYEWDIYAPLASGYSPEVGSGTLTSRPDGTFTLTSPQTVSWYLAQYAGETSLELYVEDGTIHAHGYDQPVVIAACSYP